MAGFQFDKVYYSDIDEYANKVYRKNFPTAEPLGDITKIDQSILDKIKLDTKVIEKEEQQEASIMITAGFP